MLLAIHSSNPRMRKADYISPAFLPMDGTKLEKCRVLSQTQVSSFLVQSNSGHHENPIWALGDHLQTPPLSAAWLK